MSAPKKMITTKDIEQVNQKTILVYDKAGDEHFNLISAFHKSIRGGDPDGSLYWLARMLDSGEDPLYIVRRMRGKRAFLNPRRPGEGEPPLPRSYARLVRRLSAGGRRRSPGASLEEMLLSAAGATPELLPDASRFLSLYHRERFGTRPLSVQETAEAGRLAGTLRKGLFRSGAKRSD